MLGIMAIDPGRVAVVVEPPAGLDLQFIYRAGQSVYWNSDDRQLEDRYLRETSHLASFQRIARALSGEYGLGLRGTSMLRWAGVERNVRSQIERELDQTSMDPGPDRAG